MRVDVIARQFRDLLREGPLSDDRPRGMVLTDDFKVSGRYTPGAGWLAFHVDRGGDGTGKDLERVAVVPLHVRPRRRARVVLDRHPGDLDVLGDEA